MLYLLSGQFVDAHGKPTVAVTVQSLRGRLEIERDIESCKPRIQYSRRRQPRGAVGDRIIGLVVRRSGVAVEQIVEVDRRVHPGPAESQDLADADVKRVETIRKRVSLQQQVDRLKRQARHQRTPGLRLQDRARDVI